MIYLQFPHTTAKDLTEYPVVLKEKASLYTDVFGVKMGQTLSRNGESVTILPWSAPVLLRNRSPCISPSDLSSWRNLREGKVQKCFKAS